MFIYFLGLFIVAGFFRISQSEVPEEAVAGLLIPQ